MKKQFFYAAMALAVLSSCSDNEVLSEAGSQPQTVVPEDVPALIQLGTSGPSISGVTRGVGAIGGFDNAKDNKWNGEKLGIWMLKDVTGNELTLKEEVAMEGTDYIFKGMVFKAPSVDDAVNAGQIKMYASAQQATAGTIKHKYFPNKGKFTFYGFHLDDATFAGQSGEALPEPEITKAADLQGAGADYTVKSKTIKEITIDGTQDLMAAVTAKLPTDEEAKNLKPGDPYHGAIVEGTDTWKLLADRSFSAWAARRNVNPYLQFEHKLARLSFFVKAGDASAASKEWDKGKNQWTDKATVTIGSGPDQASTAVQITSISVANMADKVDMVLDRNSGAGQQTAPLTKSTAATTPNVKFTLMQKPTVPGNLEALKPTAPEFDATTAETTAKEDVTYKETTKVGESIMFLPVAADGTDKKIELTINLQQAVKDETSKEGTSTYKVKTDELKHVLNVSDILVKAGNGIDTQNVYATAFEPGKNYNITIKVYSYKEIKVTAALTKWEDGGSVEIAPGDEF